MCNKNDTRSIEEVYQQFEMEPLLPSDPKLYKGLFENFVKDTKRRIILRKNLNRKVLMVGHKGAGKSSFMNLLAADEELLNEFLVARYSIEEIGNPYDFTHFDFLLSLVLKGTEAAVKQNAEIDDSLLKEIEKMVAVIRDEIKIDFDETTKSNIEVGGKVELGLPKIPFITDWLTTKVYTALQLSNETRENLRKIYTVKPHELLGKVNDFLIALSSSSGKKLLFLVDDTDKLPLDKAFELLDDNREFMHKPQANVIYMIDISVSNSSRFAGIATIGETDFFPSLKIIKKPKDDAECNEEKIEKEKEKLRTLICHWCPKKYIDDSAIEKIVEFGGGNTRQTLRLLWFALDYVVIENSETAKITEMDVDRAINKRFNEYSLNKKQKDILSKVQEDPDWIPEAEEDVTTPNSPYLELLYNLGILEYRNGEKKWRRPNPILESLLKK